MALAKLLLSVWLVVAAAVLAPTTTHAAGNKYPIILLHGFAGWGRDELGGVRYWGGFHGDWQEDLEKQGYDVRTAVVGPLSSNWDRACELYAYIKGGTVNYGKNHAKVHGHNATGRTFPGIFPQWGEVINGEVQKIHIIAHSMGGPTARMLAQLLAEGTEGAPIQEDPTSHDLFAGGKSWIQSISTVAAPHQGTTLADGVDLFGDTVENLVAAVVATIDAFGDGFSKLYDVKLDQWGLGARKDGESLRAYIKRAFSSPALKNAGKDLCVYSMSSIGNREELTWVKTRPDVFYYSFTNRDTFRLGRVVLPRPLSMFLPLQPVSVLLGSSFTLNRGYSNEWQHNDGAVNTASMKSDGKSIVVEGVAQSVAGRWHHVGFFSTLDHEAVVGVKLFVNILDVYAAQAKILYELPATKVGGKRNLRTGPVTHMHSEEATRSLSEAIEMVNQLTAPKEDDVAAACANPASDHVRELCEQHYRSL